MGPGTIYYLEDELSIDGWQKLLGRLAAKIDLLHPAGYSLADYVEAVCDFNSRLYKKIGKIKKGLKVHDWWFYEYWSMDLSYDVKDKSAPSGWRRVEARGATRGVHVSMRFVEV